MKPAAFTYHRAASVAEALALLGQLGEEGKLLAGGQSLVPMLNLRVARPAHLIDLNDLAELDRVHQAGDLLEVGALVRHHRLATDRRVASACPLLSAMAATIGHDAIRRRGTLGGSLAHADPAAQLPLIAVLLDADIVAESVAGRRTLKARGFFESSLVTALAADEMITGVAFPRPPARSGWGFELFSRRSGDFALAAVATTLTLAENGTVETLRLAVGGVEPVPVALDDVLAGERGRGPDAVWQAAVAASAAAAVDPEDDPYVPAAYRRELVAALARRALAGAVARAEAAAGAVLETHHG